MTDDRERLIAEMAREEAHHHQCSLAAATRQIRALFAAAREEYRAAGAPYGDDDRGLCRLAAGKTTPDAECVTSYIFSTTHQITTNLRTLLIQ